MSYVAPLTTCLSAEDLALVRRLGEAAQRHGVQLWTVGGAVRDALLGLPVLDIDLTAEAPAEELGPLLAAEAGGQLTARSQFGTVKLRFGQRALDLTTARSERYARPGALPTVAPGTMEQDLARRDFSINAMAASLAPDRFGEVLDLHGGIEDIQLRLVRVLHERSFQDDATRMLRAVRYATRLDFRLERRTRTWLRRDLGYMDTISPARLRRELVRMLEEERPARGLLEAHRLGVLGAIHPALGTEDVRNALRRADSEGLQYLALLGALMYPVPADELESVSKRLDFTSAQQKTVHWVSRLRAAEPDIAASSLADIDSMAADAPRTALEACAAATPDPVVRRKLSDYLAKSETFRMPLDGDDLIAMGVPHGPEVGRLLRLLRRAVWEEQVRSPKDAALFVQEALQETRG